MTQKCGSNSKNFQRDITHQKHTQQQKFVWYVYDKNSIKAYHVSKLENIACRLKTLGLDIGDNMIISEIFQMLQGCLPISIVEHKSFCVLNANGSLCFFFSFKSQF